MLTHPLAILVSDLPTLGLGLVRRSIQINTQKAILADLPLYVEDVDAFGPRYPFRGIANLFKVHRLRPGVNWLKGALPPPSIAQRHPCYVALLAQQKSGLAPTVPFDLTGSI